MKCQEQEEDHLKEKEHFNFLNLPLSCVFHEILKNFKDLNKSGWDVSCQARQIYVRKNKETWGNLLKGGVPGKK